MAGKIRALTADPRWEPFVERYAFDATKFAVEVCGMNGKNNITWQQVELFDSISGFGSRTSVSSGHGCFALGTEILRYDGSVVAVEDIRTGDRLVGQDGITMRTVLELKRGREAMYRFTYQDGTSHTVNASHSLCVTSGLYDPLEEVVVTDWLQDPAAKRHCKRVIREKGRKPRCELLTIVSVEALGEDDYYGFTIDGDHRFLGGDGTILRNTGKTRSFAVAALWHLLCYADSNTYLTAPKLATLQEGIWKEFSTLKEVIEQGPHAWIAEYFEIKAKKVYVKGAGLRWFITCRTAPRGSPEGMAGTHGAYLMWLADEASGIPDANLNVIGGALTDKRNRFAMASQPTRSSGVFYDTQHKLSTSNGGPWNALVFNSEESPIVSDEFIRDKVLEYGGVDSVEYQIKVQGRFPEHSDRYLLSRKSIERRIGAARVIGDDEPYGNLLLVDVGAGLMRDKTVATHARVIGMGGPEAPDPRRMDVMDIPVYTNSLDWTDAAGRVAVEARKLSNCTILVDIGGQGVQFAKLLERLEIPNVVYVNWGLLCFRKEYRGRFINLRAQCNVHLKYAVEQGRVSFPSLHTKDLLDQGGRMPFFFDEKARWQIVSKEDMKTKEGLPSPDLWDTMAFGFLENATYIQAEDSGAMGADSRKVSARMQALEALGIVTQSPV